MASSTTSTSSIARIAVSGRRSASGRHRRLGSLKAAVAAVLLALAACSKAAPPEPKAPGLDLRPTKTEVVGAGTRSVTRTDELATQVLEPLRRYYEGTLFGVVFPSENFEAGFVDFTPTVAAKAQREHASLMTPAEAASRIRGVLEPHDVTSTVTVFSPAEGRVSHAGISVFLRASGSLDDGTPIEISRRDFFIVESSSSGWKVISYECRQTIDAPPEVEASGSGGAGGR